MRTPLIAILDYGMGNRRSVEKALDRAGARPRLTADPGRIAAADGLVIPGVGAFPAAMERLRAAGLDDQVHAFVDTGRPLLGICLGMQLLFERSEEVRPCAGLGLIPGEIRRLQAPGLRVPHIGWNEVRTVRESPLSAAIPGGRRPFYHVHSFAAHPASAEHVLATAQYGERFATIVGRGRILGVQFHPEKSSRDGLALLGAFVKLCGEALATPSDRGRGRAGALR